jgi:hypothetical protein
MRVLLAIIVVLLGGAAALAYFSFFIVHQNEQALVLEFGKPKREIQQPGLHWKIPVVETVDYFDKRILDLDTKEQEVTASDQKRLKIDAFTRYKIVNPLMFYQTVRDERMVSSRLGPIVDSAIHPARPRLRHVPGGRARQARGPDGAHCPPGERGGQGLRNRSRRRSHQTRGSAGTERQECLRPHACRAPARSPAVQV